jgi:hypothetical protein
MLVESCGIPLHKYWSDSDIHFTVSLLCVHYCCFITITAATENGSDASGLSHNMTYGEHYQISAHVDLCIVQTTTSAYCSRYSTYSPYCCL